MNIHLLQATRKRPGRSNKDTNGGFGTVNDYGKGLVPFLLKSIKSQTMNYPEILPAYVLAILKAKGHHVTYAVNSFPSNVDIILIQTSIIDFHEEINWAIKIRRASPNTRIGFIGGMSSAHPGLYQGYADFVIVGEVEKALISKEIDQLNGLVPAGLLENLDELPFPDWSHYSGKNGRYHLLKKTRGEFLPVQTSRGCPMPCSYYCTYPLVQGAKIRERSNENVLNEIAFIQKNYHVENILFRDPIFTIHPERINALCDMTMERGLRFSWICETHPKFLQPGLIRKMSQAGCIAIKLGIESADLEVMSKSHRKGDLLDHQEAVIRCCEENQIDILAFYILGYFDDTRSSIEKTIEYAMKLNTFGAQFTIATPYPGTEWYASLNTKNERYELDPDFENYNQYQLVYQHPHLTKNELEQLKGLAYTKYYLRWEYIRKFLLRNNHS